MVNLLWAKENNLKPLKEKIYFLHSKQEYLESLPYLEKYLSQTGSHIEINLLYAKSLLLRTDLPAPLPTDDPYTRESKITNLHKNYTKSSQIFNNNLAIIEKAFLDRSSTPITAEKQSQREKLKKELSIWYFHYALSEMLLGNSISAIQKFEKSSNYNPDCLECYYNIASIYESLGKHKEAGIYWKKYNPRINKNFAID